MDNIVYEQAKQIDVKRPGRRAWSRLDGKSYRDYQHQLRDQIKAKQGDLAPLDWEADARIRQAPVHSQNNHR